MTTDYMPVDKETIGHANGASLNINGKEITISKPKTEVGDITLTGQLSPGMRVCREVSLPAPVWEQRGIAKIATGGGAKAGILFDFAYDEIPMGRPEDGVYEVQVTLVRRVPEAERETA